MNADSIREVFKETGEEEHFNQWLEDLTGFHYSRGWLAGYQAGKENHA